MSQVVRRATRYWFKIPDLMTIAQMIDSACGEPNNNIVNFKLIEVVLVVLARQLKMLQRRVKIEMPKNFDYYIPDSKLSVTEVKIHAKVKKIRRLPMIHKKRSHNMSMIGVTNILRPAKRSPLRTSIVKSSSSTNEIISTSEVGKQSSNSDLTGGILLTIKTTSGKTQKTKSHKLQKSMIKQLLAMSETSGDEAVTKYKKNAKQQKGAEKSRDKSGTDKIRTDISSTDKFTDEGSIMSSLGKKSSSPDKITFVLTSLDGTRSEEPKTSSTKQRTFSPTPENSTESMDITEDHYEKLLVVKRVPSEEAITRTGRLQSETRGSNPRLSIVTKEEFIELLSDVRKLQAKLDPTGTSDFLENLLKVLRNSVAWTDGMAALQMSARLEATEKALERLMSLVTDLARRYPVIDRTSLSHQVNSDSATDSKKIDHRDPPPSFQTLPSTSQIKISSQHSVTSGTSAQAVVQVTVSTPNVSLLSEQDESEDFVTEEELQTALEEVYDSVINPLTQTIDKSVREASSALQNAIKLDRKVNAAIAVDKKMVQLESLVGKYVDKINALDSRLTSKMTKYQDEIINTQYALQSAIENVIQTMANSKGDLEGKAELISSFNRFETDLKHTYKIQLELAEAHSAFKMDVESLREKIEIIYGVKSNRDEVTEALRDKVGFEKYNCMVFLDIFYAIRGDLEEKITSVSDKFYSQESIWQKTIDDLVRSLEDKAYQTQILSVKEDIMNNVDRLRTRLLAMYQLVGEPQLTNFTKKMYRDTKCFSCSTPAYVKETILPRLSCFSNLRPPTMGAKSVKKNKNNNGVCFPGLPISHSRDSRAHVCHRFCSGPSSKQPTTASRIPPGTIIKPLGREFVDTKNFDHTKMPCIPCNMKPKTVKDTRTPKESAAQLSDNVVNDGNPSMISTDFRRRS